MIEFVIPEETSQSVVQRKGLSHLFFALCLRLVDIHMSFTDGSEEILSLPSAVDVLNLFLTNRKILRFC